MSNSSLEELSELKYRPITKSFYGITSDGKSFSVVTENGGIVFDIPYGCKQIIFNKLQEGFCQCGVGEINATLPGLAATGTGRLDFQNFYGTGWQTYNVPENGIYHVGYIAGGTGVEIHEVYYK